MGSSHQFYDIKIFVMDLSQAMNCDWMLCIHFGTVLTFHSEDEFLVKGQRKFIASRFKFDEMNDYFVEASPLQPVPRFAKYVHVLLFRVGEPNITS